MFGLEPRSNGEYDPAPLPPAAAEAARRVRTDAGDVARRVGMDRRAFLRTASGAAFALLTIDACTREENRSKGRDPGGTYSSLPPSAVSEPDAAVDGLGGDEVVFDVQTHYLDPAAGASFGSGFPQARCGLEAAECFSLEQYLDLVFTRSDTSVAVLSAIPVVGDRNPLSIAAMEAARRRAEQLCGDGRVLLHGQANPNVGALDAALAGMDALVAQHPIAAWKVYTHAPGPGWWLDDRDAGAPQVGGAFLDRVSGSGVRIVCVHKGFSGGSPYASPADVGPVARARPDLDVVVYHSGYEAGNREGPYDPNGEGVDRLVRSLADAGVGPGGNVYAELGSTWWNLMRSPDEAAHVLGKLLVAVGEDRVVWGTDSIWYGSPQEQIEAFRAFEITPAYQERFGYPALTPERKRKILGLNAAALHGVALPASRCDSSPAERDAARAELPAVRAPGPRTAAEAGARRADPGFWTG